MKLSFSSLIGVTSACDRFNSPAFYVPPTFLQGLVHVLSCGRVVECEETQLSESQRKWFGTMMVNVCACGPGQQHFPVGGSCVRLLDVVHLIHRATSV